VIVVLNLDIGFVMVSGIVFEIEIAINMNLFGPIGRKFAGLGYGFFEKPVKFDSFSEMLVEITYRLI